MNNEWSALEDSPVSLRGILIGLVYLSAGLVSGFLWYGLLRLGIVILRACGVHMVSQ